MAGQPKSARWALRQRGHGIVEQSILLSDHFEILPVKPVEPASTGTYPKISSPVGKQASGMRLTQSGCRIKIDKIKTLGGQGLAYQAQEYAI